MLIIGKGFSEIGNGIDSLRRSEYIWRRALYFSIMEEYKVNKITREILNVTFSQFDDEEGYNEIFQPTDTTIIKLFCGKS